MSARRSIGVFVLAAAITGWNCGNVGPVVGPLTQDFDIGLGEVGLLSGTFFFAGSAVGSLVGAALARRIRVLSGIWACCLLSVARQRDLRRRATASPSSRPAACSRASPSAWRPSSCPAYARVDGRREDGRPVRRRAHPGRRRRPLPRQHPRGRGRRLAGRLRDHRRARGDRAADPAQRAGGGPAGAVRGRGAGAGGAHQPGLVAGPAARDRHAQPPADRRRLARALPDHRLRALRGRAPAGSRSFSSGSPP